MNVRNLIDDALTEAFERGREDMCELEARNEQLKSENARIEANLNALCEAAVHWERKRAESAENERDALRDEVETLKGSDACAATLMYAQAIRERDALRAELEKYKNAYEGQTSNLLMAQDAGAAWSEDCEKLRAEVETLRRELKTQGLCVDLSEHKRVCDVLIRERDEARAQLEELESDFAHVRCIERHCPECNNKPCKHCHSMFSQCDMCTVPVDAHETYKEQIRWLIKELDEARSKP